MATALQRWEYTSLKVEAKGWFIGGKLDQDEFDNRLNQLGRDGWEVVSVFDTNMMDGQSREIIAVLKRPLV